MCRLVDSLLARRGAAREKTTECRRKCAGLRDALGTYMLPALQALPDQECSGTLQEAHLAFGMFVRRYEKDMAETERLPDWKCSDTSDGAESMFGMFPRPYDEDVVGTYRLCCT